MGAVDTLKRIAFGLELLGDTSMRVRAYENAARALKKLGPDLPRALAAGEVAAMPGIGKSLLEVIRLSVAGQPVPQLVELETKVPSGVFELGRVPGLGAKKVRRLWDELSITSLGELEYACNENRLVELPGFGAKTQAKVLEGIGALHGSAGWFRLDQVFGAFERLRLEIPDAALAGEARRGVESVRALELVILGEPRALPALELPAEVVWCASRDALGRTLIAATGSPEHVEALRARGLDEARGETEDEVYAALGLEPTPPERREAHVPLVARGEPGERLVERGDLQGALHNHTTASDGIHDLAAMKAAAARAGLRYLGISDHSRSARYAGGLDEAALAAQAARIAAMNAEGGPVLLTGVESDILEDGSLDYEDEVLARLDVVVASVHTRHRLDRAAATARMVRAARHPRCHVIGHPTGRLLLGRPPVDFDMAALLDACAEVGTAVELNANPQRLDLSAEHLALAKARGVRVSIAADAHSAGALGHLDYGVLIARRAGLGPEDVLNCLPLEALRAAL